MGICGSTKFDTPKEFTRNSEKLKTKDKIRQERAAIVLAEKNKREQEKRQRELDEIKQDEDKNFQKYASQISGMILYEMKKRGEKDKFEFTFWEMDHDILVNCFDPTSSYETKNQLDGAKTYQTLKYEKVKKEIARLLEEYKVNVNFDLRVNEQRYSTFISRVETLIITTNRQ